MDKRNKISFIGLWLTVLQTEYQLIGWRALIPKASLFAVFVGIVAARFIPINSDIFKNLLTIYAGLIAAQGIILALCVSSMQHILENISRPGFASFLKEKGVIEFYLFFIQYFLFVGVFALVIILVAAIIIGCDPRESIARAAISVSLGLFVYSTIQAVSMSVLVRDIIWYRSVYDEQKPKERNMSERVVPMRG